MGALRGAWCGSLFIMLMAMMVTLSSGQDCTPDVITSAQVIPNTDLPTQGVRLYFQEASEPIPDYLMLRASQIEARSFTPNMSAILALWCQSANNDSNNGMWFQPPGSTAVSSMDIDTPDDEPYQMVTCTGQVGLVRDTGLGGTDRTGLVQCMIHDEMNITHTLTAGVYTGTIYDSYDGPDVDDNMQFALISSRDADPPVFTLSFNSSNGPPTMVTCTRDNSPINITFSREVLRSQYVQNGDVDTVNASEPDIPDVTRVTVTVREREAGNYVCTVTVMGRKDNMATQAVTLGTPDTSAATITVASTPANVTASRSSTTAVTVSWDAPSPVPDGYEVFYQVDGGDILSAGNTTSTMLTITGVTVAQNISCFVVAYGDNNTIPSARSSVVNVQPVDLMIMNLQVTRINASTIRVMWDPLSPPPVGGYEVFYQVDGGDVLSAGTTTNTMFLGTNLLNSVLQQLSCFVVAIGMNDVPTDRSDVAIFRDFSITSFTSSGSNQVGSMNFAITCVAGVTKDGASSLSVTIRNSSNMILTSNVFGSPTITRQPFEIMHNFSQLDPSDAGTYTCVVTATISAMNQAVISTTLDVTVLVPTVSVVLNNLDTPILAGISRSLVCSFDPMGLTTTVSWTKNGVAVDTSDSRVTVNTVADNNSTLTFNPLNTSDGAMYACMLTVMVTNGNPSEYTYSATFNLSVTISIISVTVTIIPNDTLYVDTFNDFQCNATISEYVDTPTTIMYQWLGPSLLTTGADYNITGDTLRINRFDMMRDNGRTITCMATVLPSSAQQYVLHNNASESIQLTVEPLTNAFTPRVILPGVPTAGDDFEITCRLDGVIERLAVAPSIVTLSYTSAPGGMSGDTLRTGPVRTRLRMFNPGMTDDVGMYTCFATVVISSPFVGFGNGLLQIQIPPPQVTLTITSPSNTTTLYEGTPVNLTCNATIDTTNVNTPVTVSSMWIAPNGEQLTSSSSNDRITIVDMLQSAPYTSVLMFDPADDMDTGDYQCNIAVVQNNNQPLILTSSNNVTTNLNVTALPDPIVSVTTNGSTEAGQTFSLICTVTMASDLTPRPNVTWIKVTGGSTEFPMVTQETAPTTTTLTISFSPLTFSHRGQYRCVVDLNISTVYTFAGSEDYDIFVDFPPPTVVVEPPSVPVVAGTARDLICNITLTNVNDINVMVNFTWGRTPMGMLLSSSPRITSISGTTQSGSQSTFTSTLSISPLDSVVDTMFSCLVSVNSDPTDSFIIPTAANSSVDIAVDPIPPPTIMTTSSGTMSPGSSIILSCVVGVVDGLIVQPDIVWTKQAVSAGGDTALNTISVPPVRTNNTVTLTFNPTNTSDAGQYTCTATVNISAINVTDINNSMVNITLQIPSPTVSLMLYSALDTVSANSSTTQTYLAGSTLTITCVIEIPLTVNTRFDVEMMWSKDGDDDFDTANVGSGSENATAPRIDITTANETSPNRYETQLVFSTLSSSMDSGRYECSISIDSNYTLLYVEDSSPVNESTTVIVQDPVISNFNVTPTMVAVLESVCPDSDPHDSFTLVCRAMKPSVVIPELMVQWLHNGSMRAGDISVTNNGTYVVNTLDVSDAEVNDSGLYQCMARIMILDSPTVTTNDSSTVISRAMSVPNVPTAAVTAINPTNATIMITVPSIAYTNETYHILYTGQERDTDLAQSDTVSGTEDIIAINSMYTIILSGLEEDTTYNYTVIATNCIGTTSTAVMSFRTLSTAPAAPPMNCMSSTFFSTNTTLQWMAPPEIDQNGAITGYNLTCPNVTTSLSSTLGSPSISITITDGIVPFMNYSCILAAINVNGSSPTTNCLFETAQDIPGDAPNDFTVMVSMTSLWYRWTPPTIRNGIIINYIISAVMETSLAATARSYLLCGLNPGQPVTANIRASTVIGSGPQRTLMTRTTARANTSVTNLQKVESGAAVLSISWSAPRTPHGFINGYNVTVVNRDATTGTDTLMPVPANTVTVNVSNSTFSTTTPAMAGVPYYVTVTPMDMCNTSGDAARITVFTQELPAIRVPEYTPVRSPNGTVMVVSWIPLTLEQARGFIMYRVVLTSSTSKKRQDRPLAMTVGPGASSVMFNMLDPNVPYSVSLGVVNNNNIPGGDVTPHPSNLFVATAVPPGPPIGIIAGVIVAVILAVIAVVIVAIVLYVLWKRHQEKTGKAKFQDSLFQVDDTPAVRPLTTAEVTLEVTNGGDTLPLTEVRRKEDETQDEIEKETRMDEEMVIEHMKPIAKASFNEHVQQMHVNSDSGFESEYQSVAMHIQGITYAVSGLDCNKSKNRFANIFPYDHNRVELAVVDGVDGTDYVNASFVDGYSHVGAYIAAQGPLPTTIGDFWRMIWEYKITNIVMLTGVVEAGKKKCEQYWPEKVGETLDPNNGLMITMTSHVPFSDFIIRNLKLAKPADESAKALEITHFHFTAWPDHGVPQFATSLISFIGRVQKKHKKDAKIPLMVHCSAGVGRTGTFIMLDTMMDRLKNEDSINVYEFLHQMRKQRMHMVQTQLQYVFIHDALDELITCGETDIAASNLRARVNKMHKIVPGKNMTGFQDQFQLLEQVCYKPGEAAFTDSTQPFNLSKNRYPDKLPFNVSRPRLRPDGSSGSDYINGNFVDGYKQRNAYIATQGPLKNTVNDLWRMMWEFKSRAIVMLCNTIEEGEEKCYQYWPLQKDESTEFGKLKVTLQSEDVHEQYVVRKLHVCNEKGSKQDKDGVVVTQLHYTAWPEHGHPSAAVHIIEMMELLTRVQMKSGNKPITVICNDGVGRTGAFLCIHSQLERLKTDGEVDAFKYLKTARTRRQGLVAELDHYVFCHEVLADYVESFDPYANFKDV